MAVIAKIATKVIKVVDIPKDAQYQGLRIVRAQSDPQSYDAFDKRAYECQAPGAGYTQLLATLSRKGFIGSQDLYRVVATVHPTLQIFVDIVKYDPSAPPPDNYQALGMKEMHDRTQSDFKGQKAHNKNDFRDYIFEGLRGDRPLYLPTISGWQSNVVFDRTVFIALDETNENALYGYLYLPQAPVMQSDGQTQTAALFAVAHSKDAVDVGALQSLSMTLEIELNMDERKAGQSFADRNGRGSKKNKNLVISLDTSSALSELRLQATAGTIFGGRLATGRNTSTSETATKYLVDLSTMEQILLNVVAEGKLKPENFKHFHVQHFLPFAKELIELLQTTFSHQWPENSAGTDPFRRIYVHGWPFALKAIAIAYHRARIERIGPLAQALGSKDAGKTVEEAFLARVEENQAKWEKKATVNFDELRKRLLSIDWLRYRKHWISITGFKQDSKGNARRQKLKSAGGQEKVLGMAQNTAAIIGVVANKIMSPSWIDLTATEDA